MKKFIAAPTQKISGELRVPSDKSISHRAILLSSIATGETTVTNPLTAEDVRATAAAMRACGVDIRGDNPLVICPPAKLSAPDGDIDCGNSGTLMRLFCGVAAGAGLSCRLRGDESLMRRPMQRVAAPLRAMGATIDTAAKGTPPVQISAGGRLRGILHSNRTASAQVKSALLLAGLCADGATVVAEPVASRDHTERMLELFGAPMRRSEDGRMTEISGGAKLRSPGQIAVPADISSAAFFLVGAAMTPGSDIILSEVGLNPTRAGIVELLLRMGADIDIENQRTLAAEQVADIHVRGGELHGIDIGADMVPSAIDDFPALFIAAATARGTTTLSGAGELRHKESDRLSAMVDGLKALRVTCEERPDGIVITGKNGGKPAFAGGEVDAAGDHRVAMAFCMASLRAKGDIVINDCENVRTSFPNFVKLANAVGIRVVEEDIAEEENSDNEEIENDNEQSAAEE